VDKRILSMLAVTMAAIWLTGVSWANGDHGQDPSPRERRTRQMVTEGNFYPMGHGGQTIFGSAKMIRYDRGTDVMVHLRGLAPDNSYPAHVHVGTCADMGSHYRNDPRGPEGPPNELWPSSDPNDPGAGVVSDSQGYANAKGHVSWTARPEARSLMIHDKESGHMLGCADLH
jgi:hypothetical protein